MIFDPKSYLADICWGYLIEFSKQFEVFISTHLKPMSVVSRFLEVERLLPVVEGPLLEVEGVDVE